MCAGELEQAERTTALLRAALRIVVERQAAWCERETLRHRNGGRALSPRSSRWVPDTTLEEVDPEIWDR